MALDRPSSTMNSVILSDNQVNSAKVSLYEFGDAPRNASGK